MYIYLVKCVHWSKINTKQVQIVIDFIYWNSESWDFMSFVYDRGSYHGDNVTNWIVSKLWVDYEQFIFLFFEILRATRRESDFLYSPRTLEKKLRLVVRFCHDFSLNHIDLLSISCSWSISVSIFHLEWFFCFSALASCSQNNLPSITQYLSPVFRSCLQELQTKQVSWYTFWPARKTIALAGNCLAQAVHTLYNLQEVDSAMWAFFVYFILSFCSEMTRKGMLRNAYFGELLCWVSQYFTEIWQRLILTYLFLSSDIWIVFRFGYTLHEKIIEHNEVPNSRCSRWECPLTITSYFRFLLFCSHSQSISFVVLSC